MLDWRDPLTASFGSVCAVMAGLPFDVLKTYVQTHPGARLLPSVALLVRQGGVRRLYAGAGPALGSQVVENATLFTANGALRRAVPHDPEDFASLVLLGSLSGVFSATAICVPEALKVRLQAASSPPGLRAAWRAGGLWRGLPALLARDIPFAGIYMGTAQQLGLWGFSSLLQGGLAGAVGWGIMFPADAIKSRMQAGPDVRLRDALRQPGLMRGWSAAVVRAFPTNGALFAGIELAHRGLAALGI